MVSANDDVHMGDEDLEEHDFDRFKAPPSVDSDDLASNEDDNSSIPERTTPPPPEKNDEVVALTAEVDALCSRATQELDRLPHKTRNKLAAQTRNIFKSYEQHGSQQRLANALEKFLLAPDDSLDYKPRPPPLHPKPHVSRTIDPDSAALVCESPFHAADRSFKISGDTNLPPFLLPALDRIFGLYAAEARALLKHHCEKYGDEPIFRAGIREYMQSRLKGILESTQEDNLSLSPETRAFLRSVYERNQELNLAEKRMLARATRLGIETIDMFWEDMHVQRRAYMGMRQYVAARELERVREEKLMMAGKGTKDGAGQGLGRKVMEMFGVRDGSDGGGLCDYLHK